jgi:hypothetical protein
MIIALGVMFVTSLLLAAAFTVVEGEIMTTHRDTSTKQAYYAALAGVEEYQYLLQANPDYWESCEAPKSSVPEASTETYEVTVLPASTAPGGTTACEPSNPFKSVIESSGELANTFRIRAKGMAGGATRTLIATFKVTNFLDFVYFTNFETEDPALYEAPSGCVEKYYSEWNGKYSCSVITFSSLDSVNGPMHTNDAANLNGTPEFGREGQTPPDVVEIYGGTYPEDAGEKCTGSPIFHTATKCYIKGEKLVMPEGDSSLEAYVEGENEFSGETRLELNGTTNTIEVVNYAEGKKTTKAISWPKNGLIYVKAESCGWLPSSSSSPAFNADGTAEAEAEKGCGTVYVHGTYSKALTVAAQDDLVINGSVYPTSVAGKLGSAPTGTATLGLIAGNYVRVYHPVSSGGTDKLGSCNDSNLNSSQDPNGWGAQSNIWIYAAILSTDHSFLVDNFDCGSALGELNVYGAIAQNYRGIVGTFSGSKAVTGYEKDYLYDGRLAIDEPPFFLAPLKAGWHVVRQTAAAPG